MGRAPTRTAGEVEKGPVGRLFEREAETAFLRGMRHDRGLQATHLIEVFALQCHAVELAEGADGRIPWVIGGRRGGTQRERPCGGD